MLGIQTTINKQLAVGSMMRMHEKILDWQIRNNESIELNVYRISTCPMGSLSECLSKLRASWVKG